MGNQTIDLRDLYAILREVAARKNKKPITYTELCSEYAKRTAVQCEPRDTWEAPLGAINGIAHKAGLPALAALVTSKGVDGKPGLPGNGFWGSAGVPTRPKRPEDREAEWLKLLDQVQKATWPAELPEAPAS